MQRYGTLPHDAKESGVTASFTADSEPSFSVGYHLDAEFLGFKISLTKTRLWYTKNLS